MEKRSVRTFDKYILKCPDDAICNSVMPFRLSVWVVHVCYRTCQYIDYLPISSIAFLNDYTIPVFPVEIDNEKRVMKKHRTNLQSTMSENCGCPIFASLSVTVSVGSTRFTTGTQRLSELSLGKNITLQKLRRAPTSACIFLTHDVRMSLA